MGFSLLYHWRLVYHITKEKCVLFLRVYGYQGTFCHQEQGSDFHLFQTQQNANTRTSELMNVTIWVHKFHLHEKSALGDP